MKKLLILVLALGTGCFSGIAFGQENKEKERKGGFAVGGYDNTRQEKDKPVTKRSVDLPADDQQAEKAVEDEKVPAAKPAEAPAPPSTVVTPQKEDKGNAYGRNKDGIEGKESGQTSSGDAKSKQKAKKDKSKGSRR